MEVKLFNNYTKKPSCRRAVSAAVLFYLSTAHLSILAQSKSLNLLNERNHQPYNHLVTPYNHLIFDSQQIVQPSSPVIRSVVQINPQNHQQPQHEQQATTHNSTAKWTPIQEQKQLQQRFLDEFNKNVAIKVAESNLVGVHQLAESLGLSPNCDKRRASEISNVTLATAESGPSPSVRLAKSLSISSSKNKNNNNQGEDNNDYDDEDQDDDHKEAQQKSALKQNNLVTKVNASEAIVGSDSVSLESSLFPPSIPMIDHDSAANRRKLYLSNIKNSNNNNDNEASNDEEDSDSLDSPSARSISRPKNRHEDNYNNEPSPNTNSANANADSNETPGAAADDEAAIRREQEAAEASEAEAADRSALDEQQQAQREIILAQAQSEAKAIKEQQEALLRQQQLQQQILMRRHQSDLVHHDELRARRSRKKSQPNSLEDTSDSNNNNNNRAQSELRNQNRYKEPHVALAQLDSSKNHRNRQSPNKRRNEFYESSAAYRNQHQLDAFASDNTLSRHQNRDSIVASRIDRPKQQMDIQFSDQPDNAIVDFGGNSQSGLEDSMATLTAPRGPVNHGSLGDSTSRQQDLSQLKANREDELGGDYSIRRTQHISTPVASISLVNIPKTVPVGLQTDLIEDDLLTAAQHIYGVHYDSLQGHHGGGGGSGGHHGGFYQFAESKKKGQFESGFKRGGKKFSISGHSSQNKGHATGHVKWSGKKGKGSHHWDLKHKNKKHYGSGGGHFAEAHSLY